MKRYKGCLIEAEQLDAPKLVGVRNGNRYLSVVWRVTFPGGDWVQCGTLGECRRYIDRQLS